MDSTSQNLIIFLLLVIFFGAMYWINKAAGLKNELNKRNFAIRKLLDEVQRLQNQCPTTDKFEQSRRALVLQIVMNNYETGQIAGT